MDEKAPLCASVTVAAARYGVAPRTFRLLIFVRRDPRHPSPRSGLAESLRQSRVVPSAGGVASKTGRRFRPDRESCPEEAYQTQAGQLDRTVFERRELSARPWSPLPLRRRENAGLHASCSLAARLAASAPWWFEWAGRGRRRPLPGRRAQRGRSEACSAFSPSAWFAGAKALFQVMFKGRFPRAEIPRFAHGPAGKKSPQNLSRCAK